VCEELCGRSSVVGGGEASGRLLRLSCADQIASDLFAEEQARLTAQIETMRAAHDEETAEELRSADVAERFDEIAAYLAEIDVDALWEAATESERRTLIDEMIEAVEVHDDHLEVTLRGAPKLNVTLAEVGLGRQGEDWSCRRGDLDLTSTPALRALLPLAGGTT
jgi:hypothetical protein